MSRLRRGIPKIDGVLATLLVLLAIAATVPVWRDIVYMATRDEEQSHILLALPIAIWLAWQRRERLRRWEKRGTWIGPLLIALGYALSAFGFSRGVQILWHGGALAMVVGALLSVFGVQVAWKLAPAFGALAFVLPIPGFLRFRIAQPLQEASAWATNFLMDLFGAPVSRMGNALMINGHEVAVAEACNGMRMVAALALISYFFVFTVPMRMSVRLFILAISPIIAVIVNVIRLVPTVLFYGYLDAELASFLHDVSGWLSLALALGLLWLLLALLRWIEVPLTPYAVSEE